MHPKMIAHEKKLQIIFFQDPSRHPSVILFSVLALEKFAGTAENKLTIAKGLEER